ncbi:histidine kinase [Streptococcus pseudoporcinus]|uniref:Histidine kinase n=1 Tax=Streptococcus pseudoporcinus TaxID=361101 RepID=A0A4U9YE57_9STRE|nr:histidine kinase [Streptococcus pseudoporcinus]VTS24522.1 histidine kinase [Streptococcus pseudoporcinus]VUC71062.1 histidine kinase [Streptococcus pseudoporcinus]VUD00623.1 histidine kinase [Streptococcus pseudoporcinus]VUD00998.1 histidine kinase [Streptococcus pseudoporcinus]
MENNLQVILFCSIVFMADWFIFQKCTSISLSLDKIVGIFLIFLSLNFLTARFIVVDPILLVIVSRLFYPIKKWSEHIFYGFFSVMLVEVVFRVISGIILPIVTGFTVEKITSNFTLLELSYLLILPVANLFNFIFGFNFNLIRFISHSKLKNWLIGMNTLMIAYYLTIHFFVNFHTPYQSYFLKYRTFFIFIYLALMMTVVIKLDRFAKDQLQSDIKQAEKERAHYLENYNNHIEQLYRDIRIIKHDAENIMISLKDSIDRGNLDDISYVYHNIVRESGTAMEILGPDLNSLGNIKEAVIKSLINAKLLEAKQQEIDVYLEIPDTISENYIEILDLVPILSKLFDHAIMTAKGSRRPFISVAYFHQGKKQFFIIENSTKIKRVDISQLFDDNRKQVDEMSESSAFLSDILAGYPKVVFSSKSDHYRLRQCLEMDD